LWRGRFQTSVIEAAVYLMLCSRFLECGPVRAELASDPANYPWSSYMHHIGVRHDPLITDHPLYWALGNTPFEREAEYKQLAEQALTSNQLHELKANKGWALGSLEFRADLEKQMNRQVSPGKRGRPAKTRLPDSTSP
jgi:putative transposase